MRNTVEAPLRDTLLSGQLYLRAPSQNLVLLNSHLKSVFSHSCKRSAPVMDPFLRLKRVYLQELQLYCIMPRVIWNIGTNISQTSESSLLFDSLSCFWRYSINVSFSFKTTLACKKDKRKDTKSSSMPSLMNQQFQGVYQQRSAKRNNSTRV